jgi:hypothetical protein
VSRGHGKKKGGRFPGPLFKAFECLSGNYTLRVLKMRMRVTITRMAPIAMMTQTHSGVAGSAGAGAGGAGAGSVWKLNVADQSDGMFCPLTSSAFTRQK